MKFKNLAFTAGAPGGQRHIQMLGNPDVEVLVAGEAPEWETYLYANDAVSQNKKKAVIFLGHIKSEEAAAEPDPPPGGIGSGQDPTVHEYFA